MSRSIKVTKAHKEQARKEFPYDEALADVYAVRIAMYEATKHLSVREAMALYAKRTDKKDAA